MEEHEHAMQRAAELLDMAYRGSGGRNYIALGEAYVAMARELRIGNFRMNAGRGGGGGQKYSNVHVVIPNPAPEVIEEDESPEDDEVKALVAGVPVAVDTNVFPPPDDSL